MCGIVGYISINNTKVPLWFVFRYAFLQRQRGNKDGFGIIYKENGNLKIFKCLENLDNIYTKTGLKKDEKKRIKRVERFLKQTKSDYILLHHRSATSGGITKKNTHPFVVDKKIYVHNGTIDSDVLQKYFTMFMDYTQKTNLDSEFLVNFISKHGIKNARKLWYALGVLIKITPNALHIYKDYSRSLYLYGLNSGYLLISEPFPDKEFNWIYKIDEGYIKLTKKGIAGKYTGIFHTEKLKKFLIEQDFADGTRAKSDCCKIDTLCFKDKQNNYVCLNCYLNDVKIKRDNQITTTVKNVGFRTGFAH